MLVYLMLIITMLVAFTALLITGFAVKRPFQQSWPMLLLSCSVALFIYLYGTWVYLSIYIKYVFGALFLFLLLRALAGGKHAASTGRPSKTIPLLLLSLMFISLSILYFTGTTGKPETIALAFPLKKNRYIILQGGKGLPANLFHYSYRGAVYAIDIAQLDAYGRRAGRIFSTRLEDYHIFNDTIYSPCNGIILTTKDENPDNIPPDRTRGPSNTNSILIQSDSFYVFMAHLKQKGVLVHEGEPVKIGQPIGLVGNSGFTLEPHLHIQAHKRTGKSGWYQEDPLYIQFDGKSYLLFETITPKKVQMKIK